MAIASSPASPVLARLVFTVIFGTVHAQIMNNDSTFGAAFTSRHGHSNRQYHRFSGTERYPPKGISASELKAS